METQVTLTMQDQHQASVLQLLDSSRTSVGQAAQLLDCSERQVYRKLAAYRAQGVGAVPHGNRGRTPHNALDPKLRAEVLGLIRSDAYRPLNTHHLAEILAENEGIPLSVSTLRRLRIAAGVSSPRKRRSPKAHPLRDRKPGEGMMLQIDGSKHLWFGPDGGLCVLIWAIDDATGRVCGALFRAEEDCVGYMLMLRQIIGKHGVPLSLYADRHSIFRPAAADKLTIEQQLAGQRQPISQFGRAMAQLGIQQITAHSAQAKGRVERSFETAQDRLLQEMRLNKITTINEANRFLRERPMPLFNQRFSVPPACELDAHRACESFDLDAIVSHQEERVVTRDYAIRFKNQRYLPPSFMNALSRFEKGPMWAPA